MAKILDKILPPTAARVIKLRQKQDWLQAEYDALSEKYEAIRQKELDGFIRRANKKLAPSAYLAYDKVEYYDGVAAEALQKYDVKAYMSHRAVNHKAAKSIFKAIKSGSDWSGILNTLKAETEKLDEKRAAYAKKMYAQRDDHVKQERATDTEAYYKLSDQLKK